MKAISHSNEDISQQAVSSSSVSWRSALLDGVVFFDVIFISKATKVNHMISGQKEAQRDSLFFIKHDAIITANDRKFFNLIS